MSEFYKDRIEFGNLCAEITDEIFYASNSLKKEDYLQCINFLDKALDNLNKAMKMANGKLKSGVEDKTDGKSKDC